VNVTRLVVLHLSTWMIPFDAGRISKAMHLMSQSLCGAFITKYGYNQNILGWLKHTRPFAQCNFPRSDTNFVAYSHNARGTKFESLGYITAYCKARDA
jgi:hypothetical protein